MMVGLPDLISIRVLILSVYLAVGEEIVFLKNKAQRWVFAGIKEIERRSPFSILGIDSDNGSEFINDHLLRSCDK